MTDIHGQMAAEARRRGEAEQDRRDLAQLIESGAEIMGWPESVCRQLIRDGATPKQAYVIVVTALDGGVRAVIPALADDHRTIAHILAAALGGRAVERDGAREWVLSLPSAHSGARGKRVLAHDGAAGGPAWLRVLDWTEAQHLAEPPVGAGARQNAFLVGTAEHGRIGEGRRRERRLRGPLVREIRTIAEGVLALFPGEDVERPLALSALEVLERSRFDRPSLDELKRVRANVAAELVAMSFGSTDPGRQRDDWTAPCDVSESLFVAAGGRTADRLAAAVGSGRTVWGARVWDGDSSGYAPFALHGSRELARASSCLFEVSPRRGLEADRAWASAVAVVDQVR